MTAEQIKKINSQCPEDQGIFREPNGIDLSIKEPVIYMKWVSGGMKGGGYHEDDYRRPFDGYRPTFIALELTLDTLGYSIDLAENNEIENLIKSVEFEENKDYYFNYDNCVVEYIILSELEQKLKQWKNI